MKQESLISGENVYEENWKDMPEFSMKKIEPYSKLIIRFESKDDLDDFAKLINQKLNYKTKSIWHPFKSHWREGEQPVWKSDE